MKGGSSLLVELHLGGCALVTCAAGLFCYYINLLLAFTPKIKLNLWSLTEEKKNTFLITNLIISSNFDDN